MSRPCRWINYGTPEFEVRRVPSMSGEADFLVYLSGHLMGSHESLLDAAAEIVSAPGAQDWINGSLCQNLDG